MRLRPSFLRLAGCLLALHIGAVASAETAAVPARLVDHVVIISLDGLRPDAIEAAGADNIQRLLQQAAYTLTARTTKPSVTLSAHVSMLTGLDTGRHGITANEELPGHIPFPTVFSVAHGAGLGTALLYGKYRLTYLAAPGTVDILYGTAARDARWERGDGAALAREFARLWPEHRFGLSFIHLRDPDHAGHKHGWMSPEYLRAVRAADTAVGSIVNTVARTAGRPVTAFILTADHGGAGTGHWDDRPEDATIPWLCAVPGVTAGTPIAAPEVAIYDTMPTALALLGLSPRTDKPLNGRAVSACFPPPAAP